MGRFYSGDIEGKFWFGVQSSDAADRFGVSGNYNYISYNFYSENLQSIQQEIRDIESKIGLDNLKKIESFFSNNDSYNDKIMEEAGVLKIWLEHGSDYADLLLGRKIERCVIETGECHFNAEL